MIIVRAPFRVSFAGGGSDIASFYEKNGGCVLSTTIDKYIYLSVHPSFNANETILRYKKSEVVQEISEIGHDIVRACLQKKNIKNIEIHSDADIPAGTGLGSSSTFTTALLTALNSYKGQKTDKEQLAQEACEIEIEDLGNPIGKQDQYAASYGNLNFYRFQKDGSVSVEAVKMSSADKEKMANNLLMFYIGGVHDAPQILSEQSKNIQEVSKEKNLIRMCELAEKLKVELESGNIDALGEILHENWLLKRTLARGISNPRIDEYYQLALEAGALGGKLLGAGGAGFLLFYATQDSKEKIRKALKLPEIKFSYDTEGTKVIYEEK